MVGMVAVGGVLLVVGGYLAVDVVRTGSFKRKR
jgi:hypothetical protein